MTAFFQSYFPHIMPKLFLMVGKFRAESKEGIDIWHEGIILNMGECVDYSNIVGDAIDWYKIKQLLCAGLLEKGGGCYLIRLEKILSQINFLKQLYLFFYGVDVIDSVDVSVHFEYVSEEHL